MFIIPAIFLCCWRHFYLVKSYVSNIKNVLLILEINLYCWKHVQNDQYACKLQFHKMQYKKWNPSLGAISKQSVWERKSEKKEIIIIHIYAKKELCEEGKKHFVNLEHQVTKWICIYIYFTLDWLCNLFTSFLWSKIFAAMVL